MFFFSSLQKYRGSIGTLEFFVVYINKIRDSKDRHRIEREQGETEYQTEFENKGRGFKKRRSSGARNMEEVVLIVDDLKLLSGTPRCRICHEEEFESTTSLEAPCACSGTVKVYTHNFLKQLLLCDCFSYILLEYNQ